MANDSNDNRVVFLLGAGFNCDATSEASKIKPAPSGHQPRYPLVSDLLHVCFGLDVLPVGKSIEDLFQDCVENRDRKPLENLYKLLMEADYYITPHLRSGRNNSDNIYMKFLRDFSKSPLLTFNYDSLPEILLLSDSSWCPLDGYGVQMQAHTRKIRRGSQPKEVSRRPVLHLHGSLCVYPSTFYISKQPEGTANLLKFDSPPQFIFDPDAIGNLFFPFERIPPGVTYTHVSDRVIAPVPNKAEGLNDAFINAVYDRAISFLKEADQIISIGYSFNEHDSVSYGPLLTSVSNKNFLIVAPDAESSIERLSEEYPDIQWSKKQMTFKEWVNNEYPGIFEIP